ncbi:MAG: hypothetical protein WBP63_20090 [Silvibacterium sp.]
MNLNDNSRNGSQSLPIQVEESSESNVPQVPPTTTESTCPEMREKFATRASVKGTDGINKSKLVLLGG